MKTLRLASSLALAGIAHVTAFALLAGCASTSHPCVPASIGVARSSGAMEAVLDQPGPVTVQTIVAAEWEVPRSGLINLEHPAAKAAGLTEGSEPIHLFVHVVRHPTRGVFLVDTGAERAFVADPGHALIHGFFGSLAHLDKLHVHTDSRAIVESAKQPIDGVLLTHLHLDHVLGMRDIGASVPVYVGAGDAEDRSFMNLLQRSVYDGALEGRGALQEMHFEPDPDGAFDGLRDLFGDGTFWAISVPGHTPGSIAYLARTPAGPVLMTGDACHTTWGWDHGVEPGTFSDDRAKSAESLARLKRLVARHPEIDVRLGHQSRATGNPGSGT